VSSALTWALVALAAPACDTARGRDTHDPGDTRDPVDVADVFDPVDDLVDDLAPDVATPEPDAVTFPIVPAPIDEAFGDPVPRAMYTPDWEARACAIGDHVIPMFGADALDDCRICQCTWRGGICARRATCARDVCVFADGTTAGPGERKRVAGCYLCTCDASGGTCVRDVEPPCPADACVVPYPGEVRTIALGARIFVSECHECTCGADLGTRCEDRCHPVCAAYDDGQTFIDDQERMPADGGRCSCVCDYGRMACDPRGCDPDCGVAQCAGE